MSAKPVHVAIWFPPRFYSAVAATIVEILQLVNELRSEQAFTFEFITDGTAAISKTGIAFAARPVPSRRMDVLVLLAVPGLDVGEMVEALDAAMPAACDIIKTAWAEGAVIAAHCGGAYLLAASGALDGKRATLSWWLKDEAARRFPSVRWEPSRLLIRQDRLYTCGGGFAGLELVKALLADLGFAREERMVSKLLVLPPSRTFQSPYEMPLAVPTARSPFRQRLDAVALDQLVSLDVPTLAREMGLSSRTLARRFRAELATTPGQWLQERRLNAAKQLLEQSLLSVSEICLRVGYEDVASFSRLFSRITGMAPGEFRRQARG